MSRKVLGASVSVQKLREYIKAAWLDHVNVISVAAGLIAIVGAIYGAIQVLDSAINDRVKKQTEIHTELLSALFVQRANSPYNAARRYSEIYLKSKTEHYPQDLREALVTALLDSIVESGFPEEFQNIVEQVEQDKNISLQRYNLNAIASIYVQLGYTNKSIETLNKALARIELGNSRPKQVLAESHWLLSLSHLSDGHVEPAVNEFIEANRLKPDSFKINDLLFENINDVNSYIADFAIFERMNIKNPKLASQLLEFSSKLKQKMAAQH